MDIKKILVLIVAVAFMCTPAFAGEQPEFDNVGCDATAFFNDAVKELVCELNTLPDGTALNKYSDFTDDADPKDTPNMKEYFEGPGIPGIAGDPCFKDGGSTGYDGIKVSAGNGGTFKWKIVLQKKPETDLNINIRDCVVKMNSSTMFGENPFEGAFQTGWMLYPWGELAFDASRNPRVTVDALPGPFNSFSQFNVWARTLPGLAQVPLFDAKYTSKGPWEEGIVVVKPVTGNPGQTTLLQGDMILVTITLPATNTADVYYGADSVTVKYIGIHGDVYPDLDDGDTNAIECSATCDVADLTTPTP
jgi:hypothetical protein